MGLFKIETNLLYEKNTTTINKITQVYLQALLVGGSGGPLGPGLCIKGSLKWVPKCFERDLKRV